MEGRIEMGFRPAEGFNPSEVDAGAGLRVPAGFYHFEVIRAMDKNTNTDKPYTYFELAVRAAGAKEIINQVHRQSLNWYHGTPSVAKMNQDMITLMAIQTGISTRDEVKRMNDSGQDITFDWAKAAGKHVICEIEERPGKDGKGNYHNIRQGQIFRLDDPRVAHVPRDEKAVQLSNAADVF
jgi:hypothetical protein